MDKTYEAPQGRFLSTIVIFLFVVGALYTLFLLFQTFNLNREVRKMNEEILNLEGSLAQLEEDQVEALFNAEGLVEEVKGVRIPWSQVIKQLQDLTPVNVFFSSYGASEDGAIQLSGLGDNYGSVAAVIEKLQNSENFQGVFVPSVTLGSTGEGQSVVSFSLQVQTLLE